MRSIGRCNKLQFDLVVTSVSGNDDLHVVAHFVAVEGGGDVVAGGDLGILHADQNVTGLDAHLLGGASLLDGLDVITRGQVEIGLVEAGQGDAAETQAGPTADISLLHELVDDLPHGGAGNGEANALDTCRRCAVADLQGDDADDLAVAVDERAAGVAGIDGGVGLDQGHGAATHIDVPVDGGKFVDTSKEIALGLCANYLSYDPEGLYFFNHFISPHMLSNFYTPMCQCEIDRIATNEPWEKSFAVLASGADYKTIYNSAIRFVIIPEGVEGCAGYPTMWRPIPTEVGKESKSFELRTGAIPKGKRCSVILGFDGEAEDFEVTLNDTPLEDFKKTDISFIEGIGYQPKKAVSEKTVCYRAKFDEELLTSPIQKIEVKSSKGGQVLSWVEINVY